MTGHLAPGGLDVEQVDLRDYPLPFFDGVAPARAPREYASAEVDRLAARWTGPTGSSGRPPSTTTATRRC